MRFRSWLLAIVATALTPWMGPHVDQYVPVGWVLLRGGTEDADRGFWVIAPAVVSVVFLIWFVLLRWLAGSVAPGGRR
jgi:uncharacterized membrane protein